MARSNIEIVRGVYDAFARGDVPGVIAVLDDKVEWTEADGFPCAGTYVGPEAVLDGVFKRLGTEWDGYMAVPNELLDCGGDVVVSLGYYSGTYKETGKNFRAPFAHVWRAAGGKVVKFQQYTDTALVQETLRT